MIPHIVEGGNMVGLMLYLTGPGRANEHEDAHLVAGDDVLMDRWGGWDELSPAQAVEIAHAVDRYMTVFSVRPVGRVRGFDHATGKTVVVDQAPNHVWHCSLSLSPEEGPLTDEAWRAIATDFMAEMGFTGTDGKAACRWVAVRHGRSRNGGDHVHIAANIVRADGTKWSAYRDQKRSQKACNTLEHRYGLRVLESREHARGARADSAADLRASQRRGQARTDRARLENRVRAAATMARDEADFVVRLSEVGVRTRPRFAPGRTDVVTGYSVALRSWDPTARAQWYGGGTLARDLSLTRLRARWADTPQAAGRAAAAWQQAWRGRHPAAAPRPGGARGPAADLRARADALRTWGRTMRGIDATDPVVLADATRDLAGLLGAQALARSDPRERELLARAASAVGRHAQAHHRPAPPAPAPGAVALAAQAAVTTAGASRAAQAALLVETLRLVRSLAALYDQARQTSSAADMLRDTAQAFSLLHATHAPPHDVVGRARLDRPAQATAVRPAAAPPGEPDRSPGTARSEGVDSETERLLAASGTSVSRIRAMVAAATVPAPARPRTQQDASEPPPPHHRQEHTRAPRQSR